MLVIKVKWSKIKSTWSRNNASEASGKFVDFRKILALESAFAYIGGAHVNIGLSSENSQGELVFPCDFPEFSRVEKIPGDFQVFQGAAHPEYVSQA